MALNKHFKVKDTITVGQSGLFGNTVQIGTAGEYLSVDPAIDAWGPILSGGRDLSQFIGDGIDTIREGTGSGLTSQGTIEYSVQTSPDDFNTTVTVSGLAYEDSPQFAALTLSGVGLKTATLNTAETFTIDPAALGDNTGKVIIAGDLQVDGTTTTINSTTLTVDDKNIVLASGATNAAAANGAGITIDTVDATILYNSTSDEFDFNKGVTVTGDLSATGTLDIDGATNLNSTLTVDAKTTLGAALEVTGATDLNSTLNVEGITYLESSLSATGVATFGSAVSAGKTLHVDGESTFASAIVEDLTNDKMVVAGTGGALEDSIVTATNTKVTVGGALSATGNTDLDGTLTVTGASDLNSTLNVEGVTTLQSELQVSGAGFFHSAVSAADTLHVDGQSTLASVAVEDLTTDKLVVVGTAGELEDSIVTATDTKVTVSGDLSATGSVTLDSAVAISDTVEIDGETTINNDMVLSGSGLTASSKTAVYTGVTVDAGEEENMIQTLSTTNLNSAKYIVTIDGKTSGKSVIELLVACNDVGSVDGTAYGQVDVGGVQLEDINVEATSGTVGISVTGASAGTAVTIFGTGYYN